MKTNRLLTIIILVSAAWFSALDACGADRMLSKALYELDDFYYASLSDGDQSVFELLRDAIVFERSGDTTWVGVFITTTLRDTVAARETFETMNLKTLVQFDNLFSARIDLGQLPAIDALPFVETIAPASPRGQNASISDWQDFSPKEPNRAILKKK